MNTYKVVDLLDQLNKNESKTGIRVGGVDGVDITLVMVTHVLYLKNFADRVIWYISYFNAFSLWIELGCVTVRLPKSKKYPLKNDKLLKWHSRRN